MRKLGTGLCLWDKLWAERQTLLPPLTLDLQDPLVVSPLWLQLLPSPFLPSLCCQVHLPTFTIFCFCSAIFNGSLLPFGWRLNSFFWRLSPSRIWPQIHFSNLSTHYPSQLQSDASRKVRRWKERRIREGGKKGREGKRKEEKISGKYPNAPDLLNILPNNNGDDDDDCSNCYHLLMIDASPRLNTTNPLTVTVR